MKKIIIALITLGSIASVAQAEMNIENIKKVTLSINKPLDILSQSMTRASIYKSIEKTLQDLKLQPHVNDVIKKMVKDVRERTAKTPDDIMALPYSLRNITMDWTNKKPGFEMLFNNLAYLISFVLYDNDNSKEKTQWKSELPNKLETWKQEVEKTLS